MTDEPLFGSDDLIRSLSKSLRDRDHVLKTAPGLLRRTLETGAWRDFHTPLREHVTHERFSDFVTAEPYEGLGVTMDLVRALGKEDPELGRMLRTEVQAAARNGEIGNGRSRDTRATQESDTADAITARLKRDDPELAERVVAGEITPNAAARLKGWRKPRVVVSTPASVASRLREHFTREEITELRRLLAEEGDMS